MDDRRAQFLILVGDICLASMRAQLPLVLEMTDGTQVSGVPTDVRQTAGEEQVDHTGFENTICVGMDEIGLEDIVGCSISCPS